MSDTDMAANLDEYADPALYDVENEGEEELSLLLHWAAVQSSPIVDLACGTGRTTLPLAAAGYDVYGFDLHPGMINLARRKAAELGLGVRFEVRDCSDFELPFQARFMTMTGHAFQAFLTNADQDRLLRAVHRNLAPGGVFIFDTRFPARDELSQPETEQFWRTLTDPDGRPMDVSTVATYDEFAQVQHYRTIRRVRRSDGETQQSETSIWLRYTFPLELRRLLDQHGFEIVALYRDWDGSPLEDDAYDIVSVVRKPS